MDQVVAAAGDTLLIPVLVNVLSTGHKPVSFGKRDSQLKKYLLKIDL